MSNDTTICSILREALNTATHVEPENLRIRLKAQIGSAILATNCGLKSDPEAADAVSASERDEQERQERLASLQNRELSNKDRKIINLQKEAKRLYLKDDRKGAIEILERRNKLLIWHQQHGEYEWNFEFLAWLLEAGDFAGAEKLHRSVEWFPPYGVVRTAEMMARAYIDAGCRAEGLRFLQEIEPDPSTSDDLTTVDLLRTSYRNLGATAQSAEMLRHTPAVLRNQAKTMLRKAADDIAAKLPIHIVERQLQLGDLEGATDTLRGILQFAVPIEYDPPPPLPPNPSPDLWMSSGKIKPTSGRWLEVLKNKLPFYLAWAGLDEEAFALMQDPEARLGTYQAIASGQARRGAFAAAFSTIEAMQSSWPSPDESLSKLVLSGKPPDGIDFRQIFEFARDDALGSAAMNIGASAAELDDRTAFRQAFEMGWRLTHGKQKIEPLSKHLYYFFRIGDADRARAIMREIPDLADRVNTMCMVARQIAQC